MLTLEYVPAHGKEPDWFGVRTVLEDVNLAVPPEEWMSAAEVHRRENARGAVDTIRAVYAAAGSPQPPAPPVPDRGERDVSPANGVAASDLPVPGAAPIIPISLAGRPGVVPRPAVAREPPPP